MTMVRPFSQTVLAKVRELDHLVQEAGKLLTSLTSTHRSRSPPRSRRSRSAGSRSSRWIR